MKPIEALFESIPPRGHGLVNVIIDTPRFRLDPRYPGRGRRRRKAEEIVNAAIRKHEREAA